MKLADTLAPGVTCWRDVHAALVPLNEADKAKEAGLLFEEFAKYFFLTAPEHRDTFKNVWAEPEIPTRIRKKLTLASRDHGVDLLLEDHEGRFHAVQCKFKTDQSKRLGWTKDLLSSWLAESDEAQGLVMFTNASGIDPQSTRKAAKKDFTLITVGDLLSLSPETIESILRLAKGKAPKKTKRLKPYPHQRRAINDVVKGFKTHDRGQLILPCGAGKTLTALWLKERLEAKRTLVLVPSLALLRQIRREWAAQQKVRLPYLCVCSEKDIDKDKRDTIVTHTFEVPGHVTTQPDEIRAFARKHRELVVYSTYQSLQAVVDAGVKFDLAICDEAHKTATSRHNEFALVHEDALKTEKRLYMTATPRVLSYQAKTQLGDDPFATVADMSDEGTFGPEFHRMSFADAIEQGILSDYKIVVVGVSDREVKKHIEQRTYLEDASADQVATSLALAKVLKKHGLAHALTFHSKVNRAKSFAAIHKKRTRKTEVGHVNGSMSTNDRLVLLDEFKEAPHAVMTNARCLTEGVDVPAIDCVAFVDPKHSKIDIVQAAGRALRLPRGDDEKPYGVILIPIFYEVGEDPEAVAESGIFKNVYEVVRAMADQDERLQAEITKIKLGDGKPGHRKGRIDIDLGDDEERLVLIGFEKSLKAALIDKVVERSVGWWDGMFLALKTFHQQHGHCEPEAEALRTFVNEIRKLWRNQSSRLSPRRKRALDDIGFKWLSPGETLEDTTGLVTEREFMRLTGLTNTPNHRKKGIVTPRGYAKTRGGAADAISAFYDVEEATREIRHNLGITLDDTAGLLALKEFAEAAGFSLSSVMRSIDDGLLSPAGTGISNGQLSLFFRPQQVEELRADLGITLRSTDGLMPETEFAEFCGRSIGSIRKYREEGRIQPEGTAPWASNIAMHFYQPSQREKLLESFAIDLDGIDGLLGEWQVSKEVGKTLTTIERYRERGLIEPKGRYWSTRGASFYYTPQEVERLKRELRKSPTGLERRRLSDEVVMSIYRDPRPQTKVAHDHGVGRRTVYLIKKGERYAYVTGHKTGATE